MPSGRAYADYMNRLNRILGTMLGAEIDFIVKGIDSTTHSAVASRQEAMLRKRQTFYLGKDVSGNPYIYPGRLVEARVIAVAEKVLRVEAFGIECAIFARDLSWQWVSDVRDLYSVGDRVLVRVQEIRGEDAENLSIRADIRSTFSETSVDNLKKCQVQSKYAGKVTDLRGGVVYILSLIHIFSHFESCIICFCHIYAESGGRGRIRDYDNLEMKQLLDIVCAYLMEDDTGLLCDVYNTTELGEEDATKLCVMDRDLFSGWLEPVSYTHLDVYKRQAEGRLQQGLLRGRRRMV